MEAEIRQRRQNDSRRKRQVRFYQSTLGRPGRAPDGERGLAPLGIAFDRLTRGTDNGYTAQTETRAPFVPHAASVEGRNYAILAATSMAVN